MSNNQKTTTPISKQEEDATTKLAHETSAKLAAPISPLPLSSQVNLIATTHEKMTGKKNWLNWVNKYGADVTIILAVVWCIFKLLNFYYPHGFWSRWLKIVDTFVPALLMAVAIVYRIYPLSNRLFGKKANDKKS